MHGVYGVHGGVPEFQRGFAVYWAGGEIDAADDWPSTIALPRNVHRFSAETIDSISIIRLDEHLVRLSARDLRQIETSVPLDTLKTVVDLAVDIGREGREGKPVGAIFVLGDDQKVMQFSRQTIFNPFHGYPEEERNILNPELRETLKEFSALDGAFVLREDGVVLCAGRHLSAALDSTVDLPQALGSRHVAAAGITSVTQAIAIVISESTGDVRIFKDGAIFMEIEKPQR